jgi:hypothetical protein
MALYSKKKRKNINEGVEKAKDALAAKIGTTGETATNPKQIATEYESNKDPTAGHYNPRVRKDIGDKLYGGLHDKGRMEESDRRKFMMGKASGGTVRLASGGPVVDSYDYS